MAVLSVTLHKAVVKVWDDTGMEDIFNRNWVLADRTEFPALHDGEATPAQPWPYCIFEQPPGLTTVRMSGHDATERHEIHDVPWEFKVYARQIVGVGKSAKQIASDLAEQITRRYGGHPTERPKQLVMDQGNVLFVQYSNDFGVRMGEDEHMWQVNYLCRLDVPMAA